MIVELIPVNKNTVMNNLGSNNKVNDHINKRSVVDERFEQNAGVKIHKGKENYNGGSGFYAIKSKPTCPNVNDGGKCDSH